MIRTLIAVAACALLAAGAFAAGQEDGGMGAATGSAGGGMSPLSEGTFWATLADYEADTGTPIASFNEAPMLAAMVADGSLPPVEERLPSEPFVMQPFESIGKYGGTMNLIKFYDYFWGAGSYMHLETMLGRQRPEVDKQVIPNIAKGWEYSPDGTTLTLYLREGHKWSDGSPFTSADFMFWYEDLTLNEEYTPLISRRWYVNDELMKMHAVDETTVQFEFAGPWRGMIYNLSSSLKLSANPH